MANFIIYAAILSASLAVGVCLNQTTPTPETSTHMPHPVQAKRCEVGLCFHPALSTDGFHCIVNACGPDAHGSCCVPKPSSAPAVIPNLTGTNTRALSQTGSRLVSMPHPASSTATNQLSMQHGTSMPVKQSVSSVMESNAQPGQSIHGSNFQTEQLSNFQTGRPSGMFLRSKTSITDDHSMKENLLMQSEERTFDFIGASQSRPKRDFHEEVWPDKRSEDSDYDHSSAPYTLSRMSCICTPIDGSDSNIKHGAYSYSAQVDAKRGPAHYHDTESVNSPIYDFDRSYKVKPVYKPSVYTTPGYRFPSIHERDSAYSSRSTGSYY